MTAVLLIVFLAAWAGAGTVAVAVVLGASALARRGGDDIEALADATRECTACSPADWGACTCDEDCRSIRCTAWADAIPPTPPRITSQDIEEST